MEEAIHGISIEMMAELLAKQSELQTKFGEPQGTAEFEQELARRGFSLNTFSHAYNAWRERFMADATGRLEAHFHMRLGEYSRKVHFGDVRDMSQDVQAGVTLEKYAELAAAIGKPGADANGILAQHGLDMPRWQAANAAWIGAMGQDTSFRLSTQYGALYQKYAGPAFEQRMFDQTAALLADANAPRDVVDEPEVELTPELCLEKMNSPSRNERWRHAYHYARMTDLGNVSNRAEAIALVTPHLLEMIERHDEHTTSDAMGAIRFLWELEVRNDDVRGTALRCLNRAREKLQTLKAAFAPIQDKAVPERVELQSRIQDYTSLVETMEDYLNRDWSPAQPAMVNIPSATTSGSKANQKGSSGTRVALLAIALVVVGGVVAAMFLRRGGDEANQAQIPAASAIDAGSGAGGAVGSAASRTSPVPAASALPAKGSASDKRKPK